MRELKFRVWSKDQKTYNYKFPYNSIGDFYVSSRGKVFSDFGNTVAPEIRQEAFIVEQDTGLKDKNGKEIYEGDIVEQFVCGIHQFKGKKCGRSTIWQVRWNKEECCFELHYIRGSLFGGSLMSDGDEYEVIGNIHENPELLRRKKMDD